MKRPSNLSAEPSRTEPHHPAAQVEGFDRERKDDVVG
jgi:hypothetical protein